MPNPILPGWEYIPDGEPRVFGDRVYLYGSHDKAGADTFCDTKLKVWSASINNLSDWKCHGDIFHTQPDRDHKSDVDWSDKELYAPDVVEKDGKYYLYAYIVDARGCVAVSDKPEGPFKLLSQYKCEDKSGTYESYCDDGVLIDPGVLVDTDGRVYIYCGFTRSYMAEVNADNMYEIIDGSYIENIIPVEEPYGYFEASSMRKVGDTYYYVYSENGSKLSYATSNAPTGPFKYRGVIVDNGVEYPGGNNHGSICQIKGQWYVFYHRTTNNSVMSRKACVERIDILEDGTIPEVEMTSLGFDESLSPYYTVPAEYACVLKGDCFIVEKNKFTRLIKNISSGSIIGYKYFDFGDDNNSKTMELYMKIRSLGDLARVHVRIDAEDGREIGCLETGLDDGQVSAVLESVTGRHAVYFVVEDTRTNWAKDMFAGRSLFELESFVFVK